MKRVIYIATIGVAAFFLSGCGGITEALHSILKFSNTEYAIPDNDAETGATSHIDITTSGIVSLSKVRVKVKVTHPRSGDLKIVLESPAGTLITLSENNGGSGDDIDILFDDDADTAVTSGDIPLGNKYIPEMLLSNLNTENPVGVWRLHVYDTHAGDTGTLTYWGLYFD